MMNSIRSNLNNPKNQYQTLGVGFSQLRSGLLSRSERVSRTFGVIISIVLRKNDSLKHLKMELLGFKMPPLPKTDRLSGKDKALV